MTVSRTAIMALILVSTASMAANIELPHHKAGLWQNDMVIAGKHMSNQQCFDDASEVKLLQLTNQHCKSHVVTHNPNGSWTTTGVCEYMPGVTQTSRSEISGDFNSKLTIVTQTNAPTAMNVTITAVRIGPCKPDQKGGDVITSSGAKMNMLDMLSGHPPAH
jgi:hypothetical protein